MLSGCGGATTAPARSGPSIARTVSTLGVLGDSISLGVNACGEPGECTTASWAMGSDGAVDSLATRIGHERGRRPSVANGAVSGGTVATLAQTVHGVVAAKPQLVTILIGANDACTPSVTTMTSAAEFRRDFGQVLDAVLDALPHARVLALSVPDLYHLAQLGRSTPRIAATWSQLGICGSLAQNPDAVRQRVDDFNRAIAELCAARPRCVTDEGAVHGQRFAPAQLSDLDYFHPSRAGQKRIAELAWAALRQAP